MSENVQTSQEKKSSSKVVIILLIVLIVLVIGGVVAAIAILHNRNDDEFSGDAEGEETTVFTIGYEGNGVVALDGDALQNAVEAMVREAEEGMVNVQYQHVAHSVDGVNFTCSIGNSITNAYDMYLNIYLNHDLDQQMLLTGLIQPGNKIESFVSEIPLEPGEYESTLIFTQIEDDHATIHGQSRVVLYLVVGEGIEIVSDFDDVEDE